MTVKRGREEDGERNGHDAAAPYNCAFVGILRFERAGVEDKAAAYNEADQAEEH